MSRGASETIVIRPTNNIYTALLAVAVVLEVVAFLSVMFQFNSVFGKQLFGQ
ncbi:MAG TPA: hypothetical protein VH370_11390 [Humisphaera sp.]|jgi:hypothetical protein|nr:hypothetical protein [Humisphaera sp.]